MIAAKPDLIILSGVRWATYEALLQDLGNHHVRLTYDRGMLEIALRPFRRECYAGVLGELVKALARVAKVPVMSAWSTTFRREDLERGLEPDRCFYIRHLADIQGKLDIDLLDDPPPDLAIEIDIQSSSLNRLGIYAALGVPEVWRFDGQQFEILVRRGTDYEQSSRSQTFPNLRADAVADLLLDVVTLDDAALERRLRTWVRQHAPGRGSRQRRKK